MPRRARHETRLDTTHGVTNPRPCPPGVPHLHHDAPARHYQTPGQLPLAGLGCRNVDDEASGLMFIDDRSLADLLGPGSTDELTDAVWRLLDDVPRLVVMGRTYSGRTRTLTALAASIRQPMTTATVLGRFGAREFLADDPARVDFIATGGATTMNLVDDRPSWSELLRWEGETPLDVAIFDEIAQSRRGTQRLLVVDDLNSLDRSSIVLAAGVAADAKLAVLASMWLQSPRQLVDRWQRDLSPFDACVLVAAGDVTDIVFIPNDQLGPWWRRDRQHGDADSWSLQDGPS